ncbi:MAG: tRNA (guanosine(37)-N1)-methyltransferase TrmD [Epsilonproteobacteria bacterium]|nr:tRNA (guanosine(37)-N1)-methyltransferase TrmD [Campylobacterota bacterium]NPA56466.1 tRNA (guanosine(37)-N1)-methyltransferase TrmD [Campylobacterota bacterium]
MKFTFLTLFPNLIEPYFQDSILKRAVERGVIEVEAVDFRRYTRDRHLKVDKPKIGGGAGMLLMADPIVRAIEDHRSPDSRVIFTTPAGKPFNQKDAKRLAREYSHIILVSGRYEGFDERAIELCGDEVMSIGEFVLTGGELASLVMSDAIARHIPGVLGNRESLLEESFEEGILEAPAFTKPNVYREIGVPSEFLKGNHGRLTALKREMALLRTQYYKPNIAKKDLK